MVTPNPARGEFEVIFSKNVPTAGELSVVDELGRSWYSKKVEGLGPHRLKVRLAEASGV